MTTPDNPLIDAARGREMSNAAMLVGRLHAISAVINSGQQPFNDVFRQAADMITAQEAKIHEYKAARMAYAYEFPFDKDGEPDVGNVHWNIRRLKTALQEIAAIPDLPVGGDWEEIEQARAIANKALEHEPNCI